MMNGDGLRLFPTAISAGVPNDFSNLPLECDDIGFPLSVNQERSRLQQCRKSIERRLGNVAADEPVNPVGGGECRLFGSDRWFIHYDPGIASDECNITSPVVRQPDSVLLLPHFYTRKGDRLQRRREVGSLLVSHRVGKYRYPPGDVFA